LIGGIDPKGRAACRSAYQLAEEDFKPARISSPDAAICLVKVAIDRGHRDPNIPRKRPQLITQRAETLSGASAKGGRKLQVCLSAFHFHHLNRPRHIRDNVVEV
jgi:hypothetical protein